MQERVQSSGKKDKIARRVLGMNSNKAIVKRELEKWSPTLVNMITVGKTV